MNEFQKREWESYTTSFKISWTQYVFVTKLYSEQYIVSMAEFFRFSLMIFLKDNNEKREYIPEWFSDYKNFGKKESKIVSFKMLIRIREKMDSFVEKTRKEYPNRKFTRSNLLRDAIDYAVPYFVTLDEIGVLMG